MKNRMIYIFSSIILAIIAVIFLSIVFVEVRANSIIESADTGEAQSMMNFQGQLSDPNTGNFVPDGAYTLTFKIFDANIDGSLIWSETQQVPVTGGLFNTLLGSSNPLDASMFNETSRWLEILLYDDEFIPRLPMVSVPYAFQAVEASNASTLNGMVSGDFALSTDLAALTTRVDAIEALLVDSDEDTYYLHQDCDDEDPLINPGADENCCDGIDNDCDDSVDCNDTDFDFDKDGSWGIQCGGDDCDDLDPLVYPGATEIRDGKDNNCDGVADEGLISVGDIIVSEIMYDPSVSVDQNGEWFEIYNTTSITVNLRGWKLKDQTSSQQEIVLINDDVFVPPLGFRVLCNNSLNTLNGGVNCDYEYGYFILNNTEDEIIVDFNGVVIDEVWYDEIPWPIASAESLNLDPNHFSHTENDLSVNWCQTPVGDDQLPSGDYATPGYLNLFCP